jgi:hypothetical protein
MALHSQLDELIHRVLPVVQHFHSKGTFAPHAATVDNVGELSGHALTTDSSTQLSVMETIEHFEKQFAQKAKSGEIQAAGIFYHSPGIDATVNSISLPPADSTDDCHTLVALLEHASGDSVYLLIPYSGEGPAVEYTTGKLVQKTPRIFISELRPPAKKPWWRPW